MLNGTRLTGCQAELLSRFLHAQREAAVTGKPMSNELIAEVKAGTSPPPKPLAKLPRPAVGIYGEW